MEQQPSPEIYDPILADAPCLRFISTIYRHAATIQSAHNERYTAQAERYQQLADTLPEPSSASFDPKTTVPLEIPDPHELYEAYRFFMMHMMLVGAISEVQAPGYTGYKLEQPLEEWPLSEIELHSFVELHHYFGQFDDF